MRISSTSSRRTTVYWYIDATGDPMKYDGKTVRFLAQAYVGKDVPAGSFVPGRFGMVCCADDVNLPRLPLPLSRPRSAA